MADSGPQQELPGPLVRAVYRGATAVWWSLVVVLVLLALYAGIGRQLAQHVDDFRPEIAARLSAALGQPVTIGRLSARWEWLDPVLEARHVQVGDEGSASLDHLRLRLDSLASLLRFRIVLAEFEADSLDLAVQHNPGDGLSTDGLPDTPTDLPKVAEWLDIAGAWLSDPAVRITRIRLTIRTADESKYVDIPQLDLRYEGGLFYAHGRAMRSGTTEQLASFALRGQHFFRGDFNGGVYVEVSSGRLLDGLLEGYRWRGLRVMGMDLGGRAWLTFARGQLQQLSGQLRTPYLQLDAGNESLAPIENLSADFGWKRTETGRPLAGELHVRNLSWRWLGEQASGSDLIIRTEGDQWRVDAQRVPLRPLARLATAVAVLPEAAERALAGHQPAGTLDTMQLTLAPAAGREFRLQAEFSDVSAASFHGAPAGRGLSGNLLVDHRGGMVRVDSSDVELGFPDLFLDTWQVRHLQAEVAWSLEWPVVRVFADDIQVAYGEHTRLSGGFDLRLDREGEHNLGLRVAVENGQASMLADFVPARVVNRTLYDWLTGAVTAGVIERGTYYGHGQIGRDAPPGAFTSAMYYRFRDARVQYDERWPAVTDARGLVRVQGTNAQITLDAGQTGGLTLEPSVVELVTGPDGVDLQVNAAAPFAGTDVPYWLTHSPLKSYAGEAAEHLTLSGEYRLDLQLDLPLGRDQAPRVGVTVSANQGALRVPAANLEWADITGRVRYSTGEGFTDDTLAARFMGQPVTVGFTEHPDTGAVSIAQTGRLTMADIAAALALPDHLNPGVHGDLSYTARLNVAADSVTRVAVYSSLVGTEVDWPQPLSKRAAAVTPLRAVIDWGDPAGLVLAGVWDQRLAFRSRWVEGEFDRGRIVLGAQAAELPDRPGLILSGGLGTLDVSEWGRQIGGLFPDTASERAGGGAPTGLAASGALERWLNRIQLTVARLVVGGRVFPDVTLSARLQSGRWLIDAESEQASGRIALPLNQQEPVTADFHRLRLLAGAAEAAAEAPELTGAQRIDTFRALAMEGWPEVDVNIDSLLWGEGELGRWTFRLRPEAEVLAVDAIQGTLGSLVFNGELRWGIASGTETTRLTGQLAGGNLGDLSRLVQDGFPLNSKKSDLVLDLAWPGRPDEFALARLRGDASIRLENGKILQSNKSAQLFRIFNILNADTLWRRLQLDFSDLYEAGVAFDALSGKAVLQSGVLRWDPELQIVGPSGAFKVSGVTDLNAETLDMRLVVVLPLTKNLPLAALLMGASAPIGGALFVLDKVLGDPLSKLTSATYNVKGTWSAPDVRLRGVFDTDR
ncbi:YhdP family protein [Marinobacter sp. X15-166B]|uniref:YhdP family protein n=1 Tax=Marinobacter sp. X15-166B TaxID=1897620 RepID=UPI001300E8AE|nr:YhdP family protein [Marinobacter sp. X15-166B]